MKRFLKELLKKAGFTAFVFLAWNTFNAQGAEFVIMNRIISYDVNAQDPFWTISTSASWPTNWASPDDYYHGTVYTRYEVISVPTTVPFGMQFGIFQYYPNKNQPTQEGELCEIVRPLSGVGAVAVNSSSPSTWWQGNVGVDFARVSDFSSLCPIIYSMDTGWPVAKAGEGGDAAGKSWSQRFNWFPCTLRVTIVAVSKGSTFSGWDKYIIDPSLRQPTPTYGIDYINETTDKAVPSTDQFSIYSGMSYAVNGTGSPMTITPGQDANFRTKAGSGLLESLPEHFRAPVRPATSTFALDIVNNRTTTTVSSEYEYSSHANMSSAVTGSGTYVSIPAGTTMYFRKKATATTFKSKVQALSATNKLPIAHELLIFNDTINYPNATDSNGFYYFYYNADMPVNWKSPDDYYNGDVYTRYEILSEKTEAPVGLQFGIWQMLPPETGELHETMSEVAGLNGTGSVVMSNSSPHSWWKLDPYVDFTQMNLCWHLGINPWQLTPSEKQIRQENTDVWAARSTNWFPMKVYVTVVAVASGSTFSGWDNYVKTNAGGKKPIPTVGIDYVNELTDIVVPSSVEYSTSANMSFATNGTGQKVTLTPGQDVYFRTKAAGGLLASDIQHLVVPARPTISVAIDYANERTATAITTDMNYSSTDAFTTFSTGAGNPIHLVPGQDVFFRQNGNATTFTSEVFHLVVPARPSVPVFTIDYVNIKTTEIVPSTDDYSDSPTYSTIFHGTDAQVTLTPGKDLYFWKKPTATSFYSDAYQLVVPARPAAPVVTIDYVNEITSEVIASTMEFSTAATFATVTAGTGAKVALVAGQDLYFRTKSSSSSFSGETLHLIVPGKIFLDHLGSDTIGSGKFAVFAILNNVTSALILNDIQVINGTAQNLTGGNVFDVVPMVKGPVYVKVPANVIAGGNFSSNQLVLYYSATVTGVADLSADEFKIYPNPSKDRVITIQTQLNVPYQLKIYTMDGSFVKSLNMNSSEYQQIDLQELKGGAYFLKFVSKKGTGVQKLVLE